MRKGTGVEMRDTEREHRARQLRLVLQCAGPGSVTGSRTSQCRREGRPHGGYKGLTSKYPLSRSGFDKQEFMEEVKNSVHAQYKEEQKCRANSPKWLPAANKERNHTGEQPLILQSFLAANKQEQLDGVLPVPTCNRVSKRQSQSANMYRDDPDYFWRGNSTHQYLTATEMPGQSERLVDLALGRPTRTSLLRVRQRTKSAPGVRAIVEVKTHLHKQQQLAAKTEDRYKSVDVAQDLLPVTDGDETIHQFLIGARYNRQDPLHCFKVNMPVMYDRPTHASHLRGSVSSLNLTQSCESYGSESNLSELAATNQDTACPTSAWSSQGHEDRSNPALSPFPQNRSQETFLSKRGSGWRKRPKMKIIDGKSLTQDGGHDCCIMCKSREFPRHYQRFAPGSHFMRVKDAGKEEEEDGDWHHMDRMLIQQYHLRIMGIKYGMTSGTKAPPPRSNLLYTTKKAGNMTELPLIKQARIARTNNRKNSSDDHPTTKTQDAIPDRPSSNSSKISVRISTHSDVNEDASNTPQEDSCRADERQDDCTKDENNNQGGHVRNEDTEQVEASKEGMNTHISDETSGVVIDNAQDGGDTSVDRGVRLEEPSGVVSANTAEQEKEERNGQDMTNTERETAKDHPVGQTQDTSRDDIPDDTPKEHLDLADEASEESTDEVQDAHVPSNNVGGQDKHTDHRVHDGQTD